MAAVDSPPPSGHIAAVVVRNLVPIAGVLLLHWSAANLLIVYFADTLASFFAVSVLAAGRLSTIEKQDAPAWYQRLARGMHLAGSGAMAAIIIGLVPFGFLVFMLFMQDFVWQFAFHDRDLWIGIAAQFCAAVTMLLREYRRIEAASDADRLIRARFGLVFMRWIVVCIVFFGAAELLQPQRGGALAAIFGFVLVLAYAITTIFMELQPQRLLAGFAPDLLERAATQPAKRSGPR
jgi:hypothetical protein